MRRRHPKGHQRRPPGGPVALVPDDFARLAGVPPPPAGPTYPEGRPSRPGSLNAENESRFLLAIRAGNTVWDAAELAGLSPRTVEEWIRRGSGRDGRRPATPEYVRLARMVREARAFAKNLVVANLVGRTREDHNAALAFLRTRYPAEWPRLPGGLDEDDAPPPPPPAADELEGTALRIGGNVLILPAEAIPELAHRLLEMERERRAAEPAPDPEPEPKEVGRDGDAGGRLSRFRVEAG